MSADHLDMTLLGKEYRISCTAESRDELLATVAFLDDRLREIAARTGSSGEKLAVMTALNIAHEHLSAPSVGAEKEIGEAVDTSDARRRIDDMGARISSVLAPQQQLDL